MGSLLSRFRKKPTILEQLQTIEDRLMKIQDYKRHTERRQKKAVANIVIYGLALTILASVIVFVWFLPESWLIRLGLLLFLFLVPMIIFKMKCFISHYFHKKMVRANEDYSDLQKQKKTIIDSVMDTETFNKAKEILEKYAPERLDKKLQDPLFKPAIVNANSTQQNIRQRNHLNIQSSTSSKPLNNLLATLPSDIKKAPEPVAFELRTMVKPFKKDRTLSERLVDYLIGDGPEFRYALICKHCKGHNGMALKEEFQFIAFVCCYCKKMNEARNKRPPAPKLSLKSTLQSSISTNTRSLEDEQYGPQIETATENPTVANTRSLEDEQQYGPQIDTATETPTVVAEKNDAEHKFMEEESEEAVVIDPERTAEQEAVSDVSVKHSVQPLPDQEHLKQGDVVSPESGNLSS